jgi:eukaryotic-like serine/threonine-protein kinase
MTLERWQHVKDLLNATLDLSPEQRPQYLQQACAGDQEMLDEVSSLLQASLEAEEFLDKPALSTRLPEPETLVRQKDSSELLIGARVGAYRIERMLGVGGMGNVYLGVREDGEFSMRAAIKIVRYGLNPDFILGRFRLERQILARLSHPNIARLLDGGVTEGGLPYFIMEYVEGTPLNEHARADDLPIAKKLELFRSICSAVHYAHQNMVVHSDLKSNNVLVTADGVPKLLDFGIARLRESESGVNWPTAVAAMTPDYASPEQIRGEAVTAASDGYSLGVMLYELLAGKRPHEFSTRSREVICRIIEEVDPAPPSKLSGDRRLEGDLDAIVLKAMHRDPASRYSSVDQLAEDVRRYLTGFPVLARPQRHRYRAVKFVGRHRGLVATGALLVLSLAAGVGATAWQAHNASLQRDRAERRFNDVRKLAGAFILELDDGVAALPGSMAVREVLVKRALQYLDSLVREAGDDPLLQRDLAGAYEKMGDVQGRAGGANLGNTSGALDSYGKALSIRRALALKYPQDRETQLALAETYARMSGALRVAGDYAAGVSYDRRALAIRQTMLSQDRENRELQRAVGASLNALGGSLSQLGDWKNVLETRLQALALFEGLVKSDPGSVPNRRSLALAHSRLGSILVREGQRAEGIRHARRAVDIHTALLKEQPASIQLQTAAGISQHTLGRALAESGRFQEAVDCQRKALAIFESVAQTDPKDARARSLLAVSHDLLGHALLGSGAAAAAQPHYETALEIRERVAKENPINAGARGEVAESHAALGDLYKALGQSAKATSSYVTALELLERLRREGRSNSASDSEFDRVQAEVRRRR